MRLSTISLSRREVFEEKDKYPLLADHVRLLYDAGGGGNRDADFDIVFVHGLGSEELSCWVNERGLLWPAVFLPQDFPRCRILAAGYSHALWRWVQDRFTAGAVATLRGAIGVPTVTAAAAPNEESDIDLRCCADDLLARLLSDAVGVGQRPVVFVAHSLGGLVVKQMIVCENQASCKGGSALLRSLRGCVFYATPHFGASMARIISVLRRVSEPLGGVAPSDVLTALGDHNREDLAALNTEFLHTGAAVLSFAEARRVNGVVRVVEEESANPAPDDARCAFYTIDADHFGIHRPISKTQTSYAVLAAFIERMRSETEKSKCGDAQKGGLDELRALVSEVRQSIHAHCENLVETDSTTAPLESTKRLAALCDEMLQNSEHQITGVAPMELNLNIDPEAQLCSGWESACAHFNQSVALAVTDSVGNEWGNIVTLVLQSDSVLPVARRLLLRALLCAVRRRETFEELIAHTDTIGREPRNFSQRLLRADGKSKEEQAIPEALALVAHAGVCVCVREVHDASYNVCHWMLRGRRRRDALERVLGIESPDGRPFGQKYIEPTGGLCGAALVLWRGIEARATEEKRKCTSEHHSACFNYSTKAISAHGSVRTWRDVPLLRSRPVTAVSDFAQLRHVCHAWQTAAVVAGAPRQGPNARSAFTEISSRVSKSENVYGRWGVVPYTPNTLRQRRCCVGLINFPRRCVLVL